MAQPQSLELYDKLNNKTFHGLLIAEFLAAFNDQCIHASAMFFAIRKGTLSEARAIMLIPLLFYAPWAIFAPFSGYLADRVSKRSSLIFWKVAEIAITGMALLGFWLGSSFTGGIDTVGPWLVMLAVFMMGTHSAFYVPNKYGVLPEIFTVRMLSRANGLIESTTFLAVILGTTAGGVLSYAYQDSEYWIGLILVALALTGTLTSLLIRHMPPADPTRPFPGWAPWNLYRPLFKNLGVLLRSRLASTALLGLAFFTFMLAYMRQTMYMFGESQNPQWNEMETSLVVAIVSLGVGVGSPLAGYISGGKVELGLVPLGAVGMIVALILASFSTFSIALLAVSLVLIGLCTSLYLVPLYSLLQYSAPKGSKGMSVATNNFTAVIGAMLASLVFGGLVAATHRVGIAETLQPEDIATGTLKEVKGPRHHPRNFTVKIDETGKELYIQARLPGGKQDKSLWARMLPSFFAEPAVNAIQLDDHVHPKERPKVIVSKYTLRGTDYYLLRLPDSERPVVHNKEEVPRFLFLGAAVMMGMILVLLCVRLPGFFLRSYVFVRLLGKPFLRIAGYANLPPDRSILATNCRTLTESMPLIAGIVRPIRLILPEAPGHDQPGGLLRFLAGRGGTQFLRPDSAGLQAAAQQACAAMHHGYWVALSAGLSEEQFDLLLGELQKGESFPVVPVLCYPPVAGDTASHLPHITIGEPLSSGASGSEVRQALHELGTPPPMPKTEPADEPPFQRAT